MPKFSGEQVGVVEMHVVKTLPIFSDLTHPRTVGQGIDELLEMAREAGDRVSQVTVKLDEKNW